MLPRQDSDLQHAGLERRPERPRGSAAGMVAMPCEVVPQGLYIDTSLKCCKAKPLSQRGVVAVAVAKKSKRGAEQLLGWFCAQCKLFSVLWCETRAWNAARSRCMFRPA